MNTNYFSACMAVEEQQLLDAITEYLITEYLDGTRPLDGDPTTLFDCSYERGSLEIA